MPRPITQEDDAGLVAALGRGDAEAFAALVDRHSRAMIRVAMAYVPSRAAAEEVVQETWIAVMRGIEGFERRSSLRTWIFRALGLALLGTVGTAVYRGRTADELPADLPADTAATASDTLAGAVEVSDQLPQLLAAAVLGPAREAFTQALQLAATLSGVLVVAAAVLVAKLLRQGGRVQESEQPAPASMAVARC